MRDHDIHTSNFHFYKWVSVHLGGTTQQSRRIIWNADGVFSNLGLCLEVVQNVAQNHVSFS